MLAIRQFWWTVLPAQWLSSWISLLKNTLHKWNHYCLYWLFECSLIVCFLLSMRKEIKEKQMWGENQHLPKFSFPDLQCNSFILLFDFLLVSCGFWIYFFSFTSLALLCFTPLPYLLHEEFCLPSPISLNLVVCSFLFVFSPSSSSNNIIISSFRHDAWSSQLVSIFQSVSSSLQGYCNQSKQLTKVHEKWVFVLCVLLSSVWAPPTWQSAPFLIGCLDNIWLPS